MIVHAPPRLPYLGMRPFDEGDERLFFGRERHINATLSKLEDHRFLAVVGSSGCGKSSLVRAGLLPAIRQGFLGGIDWLIVVMKPGQDPYRGLADALGAAFPSEQRDDELLAVLCASDTGLLDVLTTLGAEEGTGLFLVVDQFEELFAFRRENARRDEVIVRDRAAAFVRMLLTTSAESRRHVRTLVTLRSDFIGDADAFFGLPEAISESQLLVPRLTRHQMEEVILRPAAVTNAEFKPFTFEEHLVNRIINDAGDKPDQLPLMQHALLRTWKRAASRSQNGADVHLTHDDYQQVGTISRALSLDAEEAWQRVSGGEKLARITRELFLQLCDISPDGKVTRRRPTVGAAQRATGASAEDLGLVLSAFQQDDRNFLTPTWHTGLDGDDVLDITHESLIRQWSRFKGWVGDRATAVVSETQLRESAETRQVVRATAGALRVSVVHGDLPFISQPLMVGHYISSRLTGSEAVANASISGAMGASLGHGLYPGLPGTHSLFVSPALRTAADPQRPFSLPAVIVVGLGQEGRLRRGDAFTTVRQGIVAWAQRLSEAASVPDTFDLSATLIGSGGVGISVSQSAQFLVQAVHETNQLLAEDGARGRALPRVGHLRLIELYHDRAIEAWRALNVQAAATPGEFEIDRLVHSHTGALRSSGDLGYRGVDYDYLSAVSTQGLGDEPRVSFILDTVLARSEVRGESVQPGLLNRLVAHASYDPQAGQSVGRTLFQLLIPADLEPFLAVSGETRLEVDAATASIPWELLETGAPGSRPWAIRAKLVRTLSTASPRQQVADADPEMSALIVGDPAMDVSYPPLLGAREEAWLVAERMKQGMPDATIAELFSRDNTTPGPDARTVISALFERRWRIVHIAAHADVDFGVVLSDGAFLGAQEFASMRAVPELVFINCAPAISPSAAGRTAETRPQDRHAPLFAAAFATSLIELGVRCVIAAGWSLDDEAAREFASRFYAALMRGQRFVDATAEAREAAFALGGNTWGAYQCYGDADWQLRRSDDATPARVQRADPALVASAVELKGVLDTIAVRSRYQDVDVQLEQRQLVVLEQQFAATLGGHGDVAEAFARSWTSVGDFDHAITWYERALGAADGSASMQAVEQQGNLRVRRAWQRYSLGTASVQEVRSQIAATIRELEGLLAQYPTVERAALLGAAFKRLAMVEEKAGRPAAVRRALTRMQHHYGRAVELSGPAQSLYALLNYMTAELLLHGHEKKWKGFTGPAAPEAIRAAHLEAAERDDLWTAVGSIELRIYQSIAARRLSSQAPAIFKQLRDVWKRFNPPQGWHSVEQLRWVIGNYVARSAGTEKKAAVALLDRLQPKASKT